MKSKVWWLTGIVLFILVQTGYGQTIRYAVQPLIAGEVIETREFVGEWEDSTYSDRVVQHLGKDQIPLFYTREIKTGVCFDGKCRLLDILLYWNPVGGYQGFELPEKEFLSKTDHDPFTEEEYEHLHEILADSLSPLADYAFEEIVPGTGNPHEVDAVSSATLKEILDHIVPGAAYTTYRLWHLIYGETAREVSRLSENLFSEKFALALLGSPQATAQIWALRRLHKLDSWSPELVQAVLALLEEENLNVVVEALNCIPSDVLRNEAVQQKLAGIIGGHDYSLKKLAIGKMKDAPAIGQDVRRSLVGLVPGLNGDLLGELLGLFWEKGITDQDTQLMVSEVLEGSNRYVGGKAFAYLEKVKPTDDRVLRRMRAFSEKR